MVRFQSGTPLKIKLVAFDVDGVMTDGSMIYDQNGLQYKTFNAKDGQGIAMLVKSGIKTAIITAKESGAVKCRFEDLGMTKLYMGQKNKTVAYRFKTLQVRYQPAEICRIFFKGPLQARVPVRS